MRKGRISEARSVQPEQEPGARTEEDCGRDGVSSTTFYRKARYRALEVSKPHRLKALEERTRG